MTLIQLTNGYPQPKFKTRLVLWPRGSFLFNSNFSGFHLHNSSTNSVELALRVLYHHFYTQKSRIVKFGDWLKITKLKMGMSKETSFALFVCSQQLIPIPGETNLLNLEIESIDSKADLLGLVIVLALSRCDEPDASKSRDITGFIRTNLEELLTLICLCHYPLVDEYVKSAHFDELPRLNLIPRSAISNLDPLFEGILREQRSISTSSLVPRSFSDLVEEVLSVDSENRIDFNDLIKLMQKSLQADMFTLDECVRKKDTSRQNHSDLINNTRTMTSTQLAEHRKLTLRQWLHMELLVKSEYQGANLRIQQDSFMAGSYVFYLRALRTASIISCVECGPIVLGPVSGLMVLRNLNNVTISAICSRVQIENCRNLKLFLNCQCAPMIASNCENIQLGPYNVYYDGLLNELKFLEIELTNQYMNQWDRAICIEPSSSNQHSIDRPKPFSVMSEDIFYIQPTPFSQTLSSQFYKFFLQTIPSSYLNNFFKRRAIAENWILRNPEHKLVGLNEIDHSYLLRRVEHRII